MAEKTYEVYAKKVQLLLHDSDRKRNYQILLIV